MKKPDPYNKMIADETMQQTLLEVAMAEDYQLMTLARHLSEEEINSVAAWSRKWIGTTLVTSIVWLGGLLHALKVLANQNHSPDLYADVVAEFDISKTKEYDSQSIFRALGRELLETPELAQMFCVESLKILSRKSTPQAARDAAMKLARSRQYVSIERALELLKEHGHDVEDESSKIDAAATEEPTGELVVSSVPRQAPASQTWSYDGEAIRITIKIAKPQPDADPAVVKHELEVAIAQFLNDREEVTHEATQPKETTDV